MIFSDLACTELHPRIRYPILLACWPVEMTDAAARRALLALGRPCDLALAALNTGEPLLRVAARRNNVRVFLQLLEQGEDLVVFHGLLEQGEDFARSVLLSAAAQSGNIRIFQQLHVDQFFLRDTSGNTPLHNLCSGLSFLDQFSKMHLRECNDGRVVAVEVLLEKGAPVSAINLAGETPLHFACTPARWQGTPSQEDRLKWDANRARIVRALLDSGAADDAKSSAGWTPFDIGKANPNREVRVLLRAHVHTRDQQILAFAMCQHRRLGGGSLAHALDDNARSLIFARLFGRKKLRGVCSLKEVAGG